MRTTNSLDVVSKHPQILHWAGRGRRARVLVLLTIVRTHKARFDYGPAMDLEAN